MNIETIINGNSVDFKLHNLLSRIHVEGPIHLKDMETLAYLKKFQPDLFQSIESKLINLLGLFYKNEEPSSILEEVYAIYADSIEEETNKKFTPVQADAYTRIKNENYFSFSAPTSAGKSFLFRELIKDADGDIIIIVPSRALISEYYKLVTDLVGNDVLVLQFIDVLNTIFTKRRIFIITPERGVELFKNLPNLNIELFLFDEAQLSEEGIRGMKFDAFVRRVDKILPDVKKVFTHPFVDNPEAQLLKHSYTENSDSKKYDQNSVGKIYLSVNEGEFSYFSPFEKDSFANPIETDDDVVAQVLNNNGTVLIYTSKNKIYDGSFITDFAKYIELCPKITNILALGQINKLKEFIGAADRGSEKHSLMIEMMERGVVIHHGSIPLKARLLIEDFVNDNYARICFSTSTLTQGVNMPFDIVWINNFRFPGTEVQKTLDLKNLIGRAGRSTAKINSFDFGYVIIEVKNSKSFCERLNSPVLLSEESQLDNIASEVEEDLVDIVEAIKDDTFNDELHLTNKQIERLKNADIDTQIKNVLDLFLIDNVPVTGKEYYKLSNPNRTKLKDAFKIIFISHLRKNKLSRTEASILSTAIPILLWQIQGKSFSEIISLRHAYMSEKDKRRDITRKIRMGELSPTEAADELEKIIIKYSQIAAPLPNSKITSSTLFPNNTPVKKLEYDVLVFDTYDYIDKVISLSLRDPLVSAFTLYYNKTKDVRANTMKNYIKYGTNKDIEIWLVRYGFSFDDIEWIEEHVQDISEKGITFKQSILNEDKDHFEIIKRFYNQ